MPEASKKLTLQNLHDRIRADSIRLKTLNANDRIGQLVNAVTTSRLCRDFDRWQSQPA